MFLGDGLCRYSVTSTATPIITIIPPKSSSAYFVVEPHMVLPHGERLEGDGCVFLGTWALLDRGQNADVANLLFVDLDGARDGVHGNNGRGVERHWGHLGQGLQRGCCWRTR